MVDVYKYLNKTTKIELVYSTENSQLITYKSEIENVLEERIFITKPLNSEFDFSNIPLYSKFNIIFYTQDGVLTGNVNLLKKDETFCISFPYNNQFCQRREDTRVPMHINFELEIENENDLTQKYILKAKDISGKGIACLTTEPLPDFEVAKITMYLENENIEAFCRKVYSKELLLADKTMFLNGMAFTEISKENVRAIVKKCLKFQIASQHNERLFESM